jgi:hypothetical protein
VVRTSGDLGGYNGGIERKRLLLSMERARTNAYHLLKSTREDVKGILFDSDTGTTA